MTARRARDERGASLILALAFVSMFGAFAIALLSYTGTGLRATSAVRGQRGAVYATDGALQTAIQYARGNAASGRDPALGGTCPPFVLPTVGGAPTVGVTCTGLAESGRIVPGTNSPAHAILTLASGSEPGVTTSGAGTLSVKGAVFANSAISTSGTSRIDANGAPVTARGACDPIRVSGSPVTCSAPNPAAGDPGYASAITTLPAAQAVPACAGPGKLVRLSPGYYDDARALSSLTNGSCAGAILWFQPGAYAFDFDLDRRRAPIWHIDDGAVKIVGGTAKGWVPGTNAPPAAGACTTETDAAPNAGVHFVFGGASRVDLARGSVQLCATPSVTAQQLAVVGRTTGATPPAEITPSAPATTVDLAGPTAFTTPADAKVIGEKPVRSATAVIPPGSATAASIGFGDFAPVKPPSGAANLAVFLTVAHQETVPVDAIITSQPGNITGPTDPPSDPDAPAPPPVVPPVIAPVTGPGGGTIGPAVGSKASPAPTGSYTVTVTVTPGGGAPACVWNVPGSPTLVSATAVVTNCLDTAAERAGATVQVEVRATSNQAVGELLDGVQLTYTWVPPGLRAQSGCVTVVGTGGCPLISSAAGSRLSIEGTVYAPLATFDLDSGGTDGVTLGRGVVSRSLTMRGLPPVDPAGRVRLLSTRDVVFVATIAGKRSGRARARFEDSPIPGQSVRILEWSGSR